MQQRWLWVALGSCMGACGGEAFAQDWAFNTRAMAETTSWEDSLGDRGRQSILLLQASATHDDWAFGISGGFIEAEAESDVAALNGDLQAPLDTVLSVDWTALGNRRGDRLRLVFDGDLSLPTGHEQLTGDEKNVVFDPLLAQFDRYGEGTNYAFGVFAAYEVTAPVSLGIGIKETITGAYAPDGDAPDVEIDPGDTTAIYAQVIWANSWGLTTAGLEGSHQTTATRNGVDLFARAFQWQASVIGVYQLPWRLSLDVSATYSTRGSDKRLNELTGEFERDAEKGSGDVLSASLALSRGFEGFGDVETSIDFVRIDDNAFDDASFDYLPARERLRLGVNYGRDINEAARLELQARYFDYEDKGSALLSPLDADGWGLSITLSKSW